jgi:hypothetical protein
VIIFGGNFNPCKLKASVSPLMCKKMEQEIESVATKVAATFYFHSETVFFRIFDRKEEINVATRFPFKIFNHPKKRSDILIKKEEAKKTNVHKQNILYSILTLQYVLTSIGLNSNDQNLNEACLNP